MRLNGALHLARGKDGSYAVTYTPLGHQRAARPSRVFGDRRALEQFLAGPLRIDARELNQAMHALFRNGSYCLYEVWVSEDQMEECGLGPVWSGVPVFGGLAYHAATA